MPSESMPHENGTTFKDFFESWLAEQNGHLEALVSAAKTGNKPASELRALVEQVVQHYDTYYQHKRQWARRDVLAMLTPRWRSSLEDAFLWIGGWRPSVAFHLLYSKSGLQLDATGKLDQLIHGATSSAAAGGDLADITSAQLAAFDELQKQTIREEKELSEKMAEQQETIAGWEMVELSHAATELLAAGNGTLNEEQVESALKPKEEGFEEILEKADGLRLRTLKGIIGLLNESQAVHFLIAAAELYLRVHDWGIKRDANTNSHVSYD